jgi:uncharacterized membrane protein
MADLFLDQGRALAPPAGRGLSRIDDADGVATFFIRSINPGGLSPIYLFIPLTLFGVFGALWNIRRGNIRGHRNAMLGLYVGGLLIAGGLTLLPGRLLHRVFLE